MNKIRVLVADDHPMCREGLSRLLEEQADIEVVARPADGEEAVRLARELVPDVAIIDVAMPRLNGIEAARQIKAACPNTAVLMVSGYDYESFVINSLRAGAAGYLLKNVAIPDLVSSVRLVHRGECVLDLSAHPELLRRLAGEPADEPRPNEQLRPRELQILKLAAKGMTNKKIALELVISERTVQTHLKNAFARLKVGSRTEAVTCALRNGWLSLDEPTKTDEL